MPSPLRMSMLAMVDGPKLGMLRRGLAIGLLGLAACGSFDSEDAEQVA